MNDHRGRFVWYELLTTDIAAAAKFYGEVVGWSAQNAATAEFAYSLLSAGGLPVCGLMDLPLEGRRKGATPRWVGYVAVDDADAATDKVKRHGGAVYVPPTESNIGRIAIVADPQTATLALVEGLKLAEMRPRDLGEAGCVDWHELFATDSGKAMTFYAEVLGWQEAAGEAGLVEGYRPFSAGGRIIGGMFNKLPRVPVPFWLYYFNVDDLDRAIGAVRSGGGQVAQGPLDLAGGIGVIRCIDPQGAMFALRGPRGEGAAGDTTAAELGFVAEWGGFASRGRVIADPNGTVKETPKEKGPAKPAPKPKR